MPSPLPVVFGRPRFFGVSRIDLAINWGYHKIVGLPRWLDEHVVAGVPADVGSGSIFPLIMATYVVILNSV
jgi:hypothetical protein